jgi:hypothetical protein
MDGRTVRPRWPRVRARLRRLTPGSFAGRLGLLVVGLGLVIIGIGWNGASGPGGEVNHLPVVQAQLPWLLSGGFLGLGIVVFGAALLVAHSHREDRARLESRLADVVESIERLQRLPGTGLASPADLRGLVVAGSASYHDPGCRLVEGRRGQQLLTPAEAVAAGLAPCRICRPTAPPVPDPSPASGEETIVVR